MGEHLLQQMCNLFKTKCSAAIHSKQDARSWMLKCVCACVWVTPVSRYLMFLFSRILPLPVKGSLMLVCSHFISCQRRCTAAHVKTNVILRRPWQFVEGLWQQHSSGAPLRSWHIPLKLHRRKRHHHHHHLGWHRLWWSDTAVRGAKEEDLIDGLNLYLWFTQTHVHTEALVVAYTTSKPEMKNV